MQNTHFLQAFLRGWERGLKSEIAYGSRLMGTIYLSSIKPNRDKKRPLDNGSQTYLVLGFKEQVVRLSPGYDTVKAQAAV